MNLATQLLNSTLTTLYMVGAAGLISLLLGLPLGVALFTTNHPLLWIRPRTHKCLGVITNLLRSIPFIILMIAIIPVTRILVGTSIGTNAAIIPLSLSAAPFFARIAEQALKTLPNGLIEAGIALGWRPKTIVFRILLHEARPSLIRGLTLTWVTLIGYSAMAGAVGGGGLGDFAIRFGYERFQTDIMVITVIILIAIVQSLQFLGDKLANRYQH